MDLDSLTTLAREELSQLNFPAANWVPPKAGPDGRPLLDALVVGGGMCGQTAAFALMREGVRALRCVDRAAYAREGPWATFARMDTLRSPKHLTGPDLGVAALTYRAWHEVLHAYFELGGIEAADERRRLVHAQVAEIAPELIERLPLLNDLLSTGFPETPLTAALETERRYQGREALLIELLRRWAAERPLVLILEDVHWIDTRSWGLALAVASALHTADLPLLMVLTMRPIPRPERPPELVALEALRGAEHIRLTALSPTEIVALAAISLGVPAHALPTAVAELVRARADGNPFFAEEIVLALRDQGVLAILDRRMVKMSYGQLFFESLPSYGRTSRLEEVKTFMRKC